jgi:hypothetical protein
VINLELAAARPLVGIIDPSGARAASSVSPARRPLAADGALAIGLRERRGMPTPVPTSLNTQAMADGLTRRAKRAGSEILGASSPGAFLLNASTFDLLAADTNRSTLRSRSLHLIADYRSEFH